MKRGGWLSLLLVGGTLGVLAFSPSDTSTSSGQFRADVHALGVAEVTSDELFGASDVVVRATVTAYSEMAIGDHPNLVSSLTPEQSLMIEGGYSIKQASLAALLVEKGSMGATGAAVGPGAGESVHLDAIGAIPDLADVSVGSNYRFYLAYEPIWFDGSDHFIFLGAEAL